MSSKGKDYHQIIKELREDRNMSQQDVAEVLGTSQSYYAQYENGKRQIPFDRIILLASYFKVSLDYIAGLIDTPNR